MAGVVQVAQELIDRYVKQVFLDKQFGALTFEQSGILQDSLVGLRGADYYEVEKDLFDFAESMTEQYNELPIHDIILSEDCRAPSRHCFVYMPYQQAGFLTYTDDLTVRVTVLIAEAEKMPLPIGGYSLDPNSGVPFNLHSVVASTVAERNLGLTNLLQVAMLFELINQPRFVVQSPAGTRQSRKHMQRKHGISTGAWHKIEWNLGEPVKAKSDSDKGGWRMPLHYTRGHWRKAQEHWDDVVVRKDNQPYKWIDGFWSGHPAYGVKKSYHAPKLGKKEVYQ